MRKLTLDRKSKTLTVWHVRKVKTWIHKIEKNIGVQNKIHKKITGCYGKTRNWHSKTNPDKQSEQASSDAREDFNCGLYKDIKRIKDTNLSEQSTPKRGDCSMIYKERKSA